MYIVYEIITLFNKYIHSRLSVWKVQKSEPSMSLGYGYGTAGATDK